MSGLKRKSVNMTEGTIWKQLVLFCVPLLAGDILQQFYSIVDSVIVGHGVGKAAFAGIGATGSLINTLVGFFVGISVGATALIARCFGSRKQVELTKAVQTTVLMTIVLGVFMSLAGILLTPVLLKLMKTPDDVYGEALLYLRIYFGGILGQLMYNMLAGILRAVGDSRRPLQFLCFSTVLNLVLDVLLVFGFQWGVAGAAIATVISQFVSAGILLLLLSRAGEVCRIQWKSCRIDQFMMREIISVGFPMALQRVVTSLSNVIVLSHIYAFGTDCMAGWSAFSKIDNLILVPLQSMSMTTTTFVGQNVGAEQPERIRKGVKDALWITFGISMALAILIELFCHPVVRLFCPDDAVVRYGVLFLQVIAPLRGISCINQVLAGALRGLGDSKGPMYIMLVSFVVFRQIYLFLGSQFIDSVWFAVMSYPAGWLMCSILTVIYYRRKQGRFLIGR